MLKSRIIPCLLIQNNGLVKTVNFSNPKYVGDPLNAVRIFNEKEADELIVLDIDSTKNGYAPNFKLIKNLAAECRMPLCYGGGVGSVDVIDRIVSLGVEKVSINAAAVENPKLIYEAAKVVGNQSIVVSLDIKKKRFSNNYEILTHNGTKRAGKSLFEFITEIQDMGAGELVINSIDNDGCMKGYNLKLISQIMEQVSIPVTVIGGAGNLSDIKYLISEYGIIGCAAGSLFVFKGKYRAVLINYPNKSEKANLLNI